MSTTLLESLAALDPPDPPATHTFGVLLDPQLGRLWEQNRITPADVDLATALASGTRRILPRRLRLEAPWRGLALVCVVLGDRHPLGSQVIGDYLRLDGWDVVALGGEVPRMGLLQLLRRKRPSLLALSVTVPFALGDTLELVEQVRAQRELDGLRILVGGQAVQTLPDPEGDLKADGVAWDGPGAATAARDLVAGTGSSRA
jgi:methanogenic corrinoid protein MtbC1